MAFKVKGAVMTIEDPQLKQLNRLPNITFFMRRKKVIHMAPILAEHHTVEVTCNILVLFRDANNHESKISFSATPELLENLLQLFKQLVSNLASLEHKLEQKSSASSESKRFTPG